VTDWENIAPAETFPMRCKTHTGLILLAPADGGWAWAACAARLQGDCLGFSEPLGMLNGQVNPRRFAPTRDAALAAAAAKIRERIPDKPMLEWLDGLAQSQPDLFGAVA
jgi:hypothetical protein